MRIVDGGGGDEIGKSVSVIPNPVDNVSNILLKINDPTAEAAEITNEYQITIPSMISPTAQKSAPLPGKIPEE